MIRSFAQFKPYHFTLGTGGGLSVRGLVLDVQSIQITFSQCVDITDTTGIQVNIASGGWEEVAAVASGAEKIWEFTTTTAIAEGDSVEWQYLGGEDSIVGCVDAVDVGALGPKTITNGLELTAPTLDSVEVGTVADNVFVLVFSEDVSSADFTAGWTIEADAVELTIEDATESPAGTVQITTTESVYEGQTVTASYDAGTGDIVDVSGYPDGNALASITDEAVTNNSETSGAPTLVSIAVTPDTGTIDYGSTQQFTATGTYSDASAADITGDVTWDSSDDAVSTITAGGLATGVGVGTATISATLDAVSGDTTLAVAWTPALLYLSGEKGITLQISDLSLLCQTYDGTDGNVAVNDPVGRIKAKYGDSISFIQPTAASRPILRADGALYYLEFDGVDDSLYGASALNLSATDSLTLAAGVMRTGLTGGVQIVVEHGPSYTGAGVYTLQPQISGTAWLFGSKGTVSATTSTPLTDNTKYVHVDLADISTPIITSRLNGAEVASSSASQGTGNYTSQVVNIGRRNNATNPYKGRLYGLIIRGKQSSAGEIALIESWLNDQTGAY